MRKIIVYSTKGKSGSFESDATTWGDIKDQVINIVGNLDNLIATENVDKTNLEHTDAVLPEGEFKIFLRPSKTKSGARYEEMSFSELRDIIKEEGNKCKEYLNEVAKETNRNWTQLKTAELQQLIKDYFFEQGSVEGSAEEVKPDIAIEEERSETERECLEREFRELERGF